MSRMVLDLYISLLVLLLVTTQVRSECKQTDKVCEFWLSISHRLTMMKGREAVYAKDGELYMWDDASASQPVDGSDVITADGWEDPRLVVTVNGSLPGPSIEVWEGQTLVVHVTNEMQSSSASIHWHGLHQRGTPWMDGVPFVTQCPIGPHQTFTYKFKAYPAGTFWYHSHIGSQLSMGVVGPLIVRKKEGTPEPEHIMMLQEWNHNDDADLIMAKMVYGAYRFRKQIQPTKSIEGTYFSLFPFDSGLINGRGRYYDRNNGTHNESPLTTFKVTEGQTYRFRMIGSGSLYPFKVSIDNHPLTVVATDGFDVVPEVFDAIIINPGERYDFLVHADKTPGRYMIRAESLEIDVKYHIGEAILEYENATGDGYDMITGQARECSESFRCRVLNCPFLHYPTDYFSDCVFIGDLRSKVRGHGVPGANSPDVEDIFLNFAFPGDGWTPGSVNGRSFKHHSTSPLTQPTEVTDSCDPEKCGEDKICACPYTISIENGKSYNLVLMNMGSGRGWAHPIHLHGHSFYVLKIGLPSYDSVTGQVGEDNQDINCGGNTTQFCNEAFWRDSSWSGNSVDGLNFDSPPIKDTIMVPSGGYVVVRIKADNPGLWFMHCHIELHSGDGMAVIVNESYPLHPPPPVGFRTCGDFRYNDDKYGWPTSHTIRGTAQDNNAKSLHEAGYPLTKGNIPESDLTSSDSPRISQQTISSGNEERRCERQGGC